MDATTSERRNNLCITSHDRLGLVLYFSAIATSFVTENTSIAMCLLFTLFYSSRGWPGDITGIF